MGNSSGEAGTIGLDLSQDHGDLKIISYIVISTTVDKTPQVWTSGE